jgi:hypothetical protein
MPLGILALRDNRGGRMNIELLKEIEHQLHITAGMLVMDNTDGAKQQVHTMLAGVHMIVRACEDFPMTKEELEEEFKLRMKEIPQ